MRLTGTARNRELLQSPRPTSWTRSRPAAWPLGPVPSKPLRPKPGYAAPPRDPKAKPAVAAVALFGQSSDRIQALLRQIETKQSWGAGFVPIFLTDNPDHQVLRLAGYNLEYFPTGIYGTPDQAAAFQARFRTVYRKWKAAFLIDLGQPGFLRDRIENLDQLFQRKTTGGAHFSPMLPKPDPGFPPPQDLAGLRAEYHLKGLNRRPDRFVLYRILGNDLPPRHEMGQTVKNLRFILENEPPLPNVDKRWVVNRIIDPEQEAAILALLQKHEQPYLHIPFVLEDYARVDWDIEAFPQPGFFLRGKYGDMLPYDQKLADYQLHRLKNSYVHQQQRGAKRGPARRARAREMGVALGWELLPDPFGVGGDPDSGQGHALPEVFRRPDGAHDGQCASVGRQSPPRGRRRTAADFPLRRRGRVQRRLLLWPSPQGRDLLAAGHSRRLGRLARYDLGPGAARVFRTKRVPLATPDGWRACFPDRGSWKWLVKPSCVPVAKRG